MKLFKKQEPETVDIKGHPLVCPICSNRHFWTRDVQLHSAVATFFNLEWTGRTATCFVCSDCTYIFWFLG